MSQSIVIFEGESPLSLFYGQGSCLFPLVGTISIPIRLIYQGRRQKGLIPQAVVSWASSFVAHFFFFELKICANSGHVLRRKRNERIGRKNSEASFSVTITVSGKWRARLSLPRGNKLSFFLLALLILND